MLQAVIDEAGIVTAVNDWDEGVGIPCQSDVQVGWQWTGVNFVESTSIIEARYDEALMAHFDAVARSGKYDNRLTCALRAGYPGPFQQEGIAFGIWMDDCNLQAYGIMSDVLSGVRPLPTIEQFLAELPEMNWG